MNRIKYIGSSYDYLNKLIVNCQKDLDIKIKEDIFMKMIERVIFRAKAISKTNKCIYVKGSGFIKMIKVMPLFMVMTKIKNLIK